MLREFGSYAWSMIVVVSKLMIIVYCANRFIHAVDVQFFLGFLWILPISLIITYTGHNAYKRGYEKGHLEGHHKGYALAKDIASTPRKDTRRSF